MPEPFKNVFDENLVTTMADAIAQGWPLFDKRGFLIIAMKDLEALELKQRSSQITTALTAHLPSDFEQAAAIVLASLKSEDVGEQKASKPGIRGWAIMPLADFVGQQGLDHFDLGMGLLKEMTKYFSSEFGIRYFILHDPERALSIIRTWTNDPDHHVRRLVSEGTRPRLPWGMQLPVFIDDPKPLIPLLDVLKDDDEEYVRRSVANNLNDIAKDHPDLVADIAKKWLSGASTQRQKLVKHGCRTLLKNGHGKALSVFGFTAPLIKNVHIELDTPELSLGDSLALTLNLESDTQRDQSLMIDYAVHHQKANGKTSAKVFKWKTVMLKKGAQLVSVKKHTIKKITTRVYYSGAHRIEVMVNGVVIGGADFILRVEL